MADAGVCAVAAETDGPATDGPAIDGAGDGAAGDGAVGADGIDGAHPGAGWLSTEAAPAKGVTVAGVGWPL